MATRLLPFLLPFPVDFLSIALGYPLKTVGLLNLCGARLLSGVLLLGSDALVIGSDVLVLGFDVLVLGSDALVIGSDVLVLGFDVLVLGSDVLVIGSDVLVFDWGITFPAGAT